MFYSNLAPGEKITSHDTKRPNVNFAGFMAAVLKPIAASFGIPPETFFLEYGNNFSASRMAQIDFKHECDLRAYNFAIQCPNPIYREWFIGECLNGNINAPGFLETWRDPSKYYIHNAWLNVNWRGLPVVNVDFLKQVKALEIISNKAWYTDEIITEQFMGGDWWSNVTRKKAENQALSEANEPLNQQSTTSAEFTQKELSATIIKLEDLETKLEGFEEKLIDMESSK